MLAFMEELTRNAGQITLDHFRKLNSGEIYLKSQKDVVTAIDRETEQFITSEIHKRFPDDNIFGEEFGHHPQTASPVQWIIDPIDGTASYSRGQYGYCVSIARWVNGVPEQGVVYAPALDDLYCAEKGFGSFRNGERIHVSGMKDFITSCCATGFACLRANRTKNNLNTFCRIAPMTREIRRSGSAALDLCHVADGQIDFYWEFPLNAYDVGAGLLIVREAGGTVTDFDGGNFIPEKGIAASNGILHAGLLRILKETDYR